jgi:iron complex outermembrane receptor protein
LAIITMATFAPCISVRAGFRRDGATQSAGRYLVSGEAYASPTGDRWNLAKIANPQGYTSTDIHFTGQGAHLLGRDEWLRDGTESALQSYIDWQDINAEGELRQKRVMIDIDFQQRRLLGAAIDVVWGLGYRNSRDDIEAQVFSQAPLRS